MEIGTMQGLTAVTIGILLVVLGYWKGKHDGIAGAVESLFNMGVLAVDEDDNVIAGPEINKKKLSNTP